MIPIENATRSHTIGSRKVFPRSRVTAEIPDGALAFVEPSDSGKSSLLYLIGASDEPFGDIAVSGLGLKSFDVAAIGRDERYGLTAFENVLVPCPPKPGDPILELSDGQLVADQVVGT